MTARVNEGPLDLTRRLTSEAEEIDALIGEYSDLAPPDMANIKT